MALSGTFDKKKVKDSFLEKVFIVKKDQLDL